MKKSIYLLPLLIAILYVLYQKGYILKNYTDVNVHDAYKMLHTDSNITLLDVRTAKEIKEDGKIENSVLIPLHELKKNLDKLDKNRKIYIYCRSGNRSIKASRILGYAGYHPYNITGGIKAWKRANLPLKSK